MEKLKEKIIEGLKDLGGDAKEISVKKLGSLDQAEISKASTLLSEIVHQVESVAGETKALNGGDKLNLAADVLNSFINIPYVPEWTEKMIFRLVISFVVQTLNRKLGKHWGESDAQGQKSS